MSSAVKNTFTNDCDVKSSPDCSESEIPDHIEVSSPVTDTPKKPTSAALELRRMFTNDDAHSDTEQIHAKVLNYAISKQQILK